MNGEFTQGEFQGKVLQKLENIETTLTKKVDREEFAPIKSVVYGLVGLILIGVTSALLAIVVRAAEKILP